MLNTAPLCLMSLRNRKTFPAQGCVMEMEDVFEQASGIPIVSPAPHEDWGRTLDRQGVSAPRLLIIAIDVADVVEVLREVSNLRRRFDSVHAYIYDCWPGPMTVAVSSARKRFSSWYRTVRKLDGVFLPTAEGAELFTRCYGPPATYVPLAADVVRFGSRSGERAISVNGYGRQLPGHIDILARQYNRTDSGRVLHHTNHMVISRVTDLTAHRAWFWKLLSMSQIALAYDLPRVDPDGRGFPFSIVGQRWFESLAAGCAVVGYRPACAEADDLLHWVDSTIECPEDPRSFLELIESLLGDPVRLERMRSSNYMHMAREHDWGHRAVDILRALGIPIPATLTERLSQLAGLAGQGRQCN